MPKKDDSSALRRLGMSELFISPVGLGCLQFSRGRGVSGLLWPTLGAQGINGIVKASLDGGVNWFDTAELYGWGESERALARSLGELNVPRDEVIIATKWWPLLRTAGSIKRTVGERLSSLSVDLIDLHQIHNPFSLSSIGSQMKEMAGLVETGKVRYVGVSNYSAERMRKAHLELSRLGLALVSNQMKYSLFNRKIETNGVLDAAKDLGVTVIAYSPLARGLLTGKFHERPELLRERKFFRRLYGSLTGDNIKNSAHLIEALGELGGKYNATPSQIALNWLINFHGDTVVVIPGATRVEHAADNAASMSFKLSQDDLAYLDDVSSRLTL
ncbi:MAG: aldo/keto reductase [Deltaproteobacteria bacterium]